MKIIQKIFENFFSKSVSNTESSQSNNYILFSFDQFNDPYIKIQLKNIDSQSAKKFADLLFNINQGYLQSLITNILVDMSKNDNEINDFVQKILVSWVEKTNIQNITYSDEPMIKPTIFNKNHI